MDRPLRFAIPKHADRLESLMHREYPGFRDWFSRKMDQVHDDHQEELSTPDFRRFLKGSRHLPNWRKMGQQFSDEMVLYFMTFFADSALGIQLFQWHRNELGLSHFKGMENRQPFRNDPFLKTMLSFLVLGRSMVGDQPFTDFTDLLGEDLKVGFFMVPEVNFMQRTFSAKSEIEGAKSMEESLEGDAEAGFMVLCDAVQMAYEAKKELIYVIE